MLCAPLGAAARPLEVPGFAAAEVEEPSGRGPRPLVVVLHGNFDRPEWQCDVWRRVVAGRAWVLCTRGVRRTDVPLSLDRWEYRGRPLLVREVEAARAALVSGHPGRVADGPDLWVGFSLGAIHLSPLALRSPASHRRLVLVEGGLDPWTRAAARRWGAAGGERILLACGRPGCRRQAEGVARWLERGGAEARVVYAPVGHGYGDELIDRMREAFGWLVDGDARF